MLKDWTLFAPALLLALSAATPGVCLAQSGTSVSSASALTAARQAATTTQEGGVPRVFAPTMPRTTYSRYPWKTGIVATVFWVGETPTQNNPRTNTKSSWDTQWMQNYGGFDDPDPTKRTANYIPAAFVPKQNPFYIALPYNDVLDSSTTKPDAVKIPWYQQRFKQRGKSIIKGQWLAIRYGNRVCYAQWEDCGPFVTDDVDYVFGPQRPKNTSNNGAGLDISPAVRDYLGMKSGTQVDWRFVDLNEIPDGPWRWYGTNNQFVTSKSTEKAVLAARLEELRRMRDEYFRQNGADAYQRR